MNSAIGRKLTTVEVHDVACIIARAVLSGGIRRSAMISLFSPDDEGMLTAKMGEWWNVRSERAFANNSAVLLRGRDDELFHTVFSRAEDSGSGEPGVYWVDDLKYGTNPCGEITLNNMQYCNLTTINAGTITSQRDFNDRATAAGIIGTLQASYTNFHYLRPEWRRMTEEEALLGVSMTGIASEKIDDLEAYEAASHAVAANDFIARMIGINPAARVTAIKPEGTASLVAGTSSGIHAWHDKFFIRRMRFNKVEAIAQYLMRVLPYRPESNDADPEIVEDDVFNPNQIVVAIPQRAPEGAITREEGALELLDRVSRYHAEWIRPGNNYGGMTNNISATVNIKDNEWGNVRRWMWNNRFDYNGLSLLPYADHTYRQAPYQSCDEETFNRLTARIAAAKVDLREVSEWNDETSLSEQAACAGGACELPW
jgi:ribonucleoside-triphosphate reductase